MKKGKVVLAIAFFLFLTVTMAFSNGLNLNSLGARATAMGGAFVGLADDFSAVFWNPAGMAWFTQKTFGFYGTDIIPSGTYKMEAIVPGLGSLTLVDAKSKTKHYLAGMAAYYHPITSNLVAGIGVYSPSGLGASWDGMDFTVISHDKVYEWESKVGVVSISPALAYKINDMFAVGATLNINYGMFGLKMHAGTAQLPIPPYELDLGQYEDSMTGWGYGATFGVMFKPNEMISAGATFKTASKVKFEGDVTISNMGYLGLKTKSGIKRDITWPMWLAGGVAFKPVENLVLTGDIQWTQWSKIDVMETVFVDSMWKYMMALSGDDKRPMHWRDKAQIRFGAEYRINPALAVRGGYYYDPSPAPDRTMNVLLPNFDFNNFTLGLGYSLNGLQIDFSVEYLMAKERNIDFVKKLTDPEYETAMPGIYNMKIFAPGISVSYKF